MHDEAQEAAPSVVVPENEPADNNEAQEATPPVVMPENDAAPEAKPAADVEPQNDTDAAEEAAVIDNAKIACAMGKRSSGGGPPATFTGRTQSEIEVLSEMTFASVVSNPKDIMTKLR